MPNLRLCPAYLKSNANNMKGINILILSIIKSTIRTFLARIVSAFKDCMDSNFVIWLQAYIDRQQILLL